ncbi:MAG: glycosyltransferase family 4 protein [Alteromonadaceae bacterium]|nr:glycosyltransferase family 4 protein [Alteromonadaceae bacterium]
MDILIRLDSLAAPRTGIGYYTEHLTRALLDMPEVNVSGIFGRRLISQREALRELLAEPSESVAGGSARILGKIRPWVRAVPGVYPLRKWVCDKQATRSAESIGGMALYHEPNFIPFPFSGQTVLTVHDLSHLRYPQFHPAERVRFLNRYLPSAIERASAIITVSRFTADEVVRFFPDAAGKVVPVHLGVEGSLVMQDEPQAIGTLNQYGLPYKGYLLSVATMEPRKNLAGLVRAYWRLPASLQERWPLVLVGGGGWKNGELTSLLAENSGAGTVRVLGRVPRGHLAGLLSGARLFAYPSFYEGFGLPIAEARACGTPVLTTNYGAMAEVAGDQAALVNPDELADGLKKALCDMPETVEPFRYSWQDTARETVNVYSQVLG